MKAYHLVITEPAEADLKEMAEYVAIELQEPSVAQDLITKISEAIFELEKMLERGALVDDEMLANSGIRKWMVKNYIVFYIVREKDQVVSIVRILYGRRNWNKLL